MRALLAAAAASALVAVPSAVQAKDQRPCVSKREFNSAFVQTKATLEERWEVTGLGRRATIPGYGSAVIYPRCGYAMDEAWYGVSYVPRGKHLLALGVTWWKDSAATLHGHARLS